jgi:hypothetical protein
VLSAAHPMRLGLTRFGLVAALLAGGWGSALAAAVCPHAGGRARAAHACCRLKAKRKAKAESAAHCHASAGRSAATPHAAGHGEHQSSHDVHAAADGSREGLETAHDARGAEHRVVSRAGYASRPAGLCAHCVGRSELPPASSHARERNGGGRVQSEPAPRVPKHPAPTLASFAAPPAPTQHAPPGAARLYVLHSVFLI